MLERAWVINAGQVALPVIEAVMGFTEATLTGTMDGTNPTFQLTPAPINGVMVFWNGTLLKQGTQDQDGQYTVAGALLIFNGQAIPAPGINVRVFVW